MGPKTSIPDSIIVGGDGYCQAKKSDFVILTGVKEFSIIKRERAKWGPPSPILTYFAFFPFIIEPLSVFQVYPMLIQALLFWFPSQQI